MNGHICFESIDCDDLQYVKPAKQWVCLRYCVDLDYVQSCMKCQFDRMRREEDKIRREKKRGELL